jgi:hypothetical protein
MGMSAMLRLRFYTTFSAFRQLPKEIASPQSGHIPSGIPAPVPEMQPIFLGFPWNHLDFLGQNSRSGCI